MILGEQIKRIRTFRRLTLPELDLKLSTSNEMLMFM